MVERDAIFWADLGPPAGRRPVCVLARTPAAEVLSAVTCAAVTRTIRGIASEVEIGPDQGLPAACAINCDSLFSVPIELLDPRPVGVLGFDRRIALDQALRCALDIRY